MSRKKKRVERLLGRPGRLRKFFRRLMHPPPDMKKSPAQRLADEKLHQGNLWMLCIVLGLGIAMFILWLAQSSVSGG